MLLHIRWPVSVRLLIIANEDSKQDDHGNLPHEADSGQTDPDVSVLRTAPEVFAAVNAVPHLGSPIRPKRIFSQDHVLKQTLTGEAFIVESSEVCQIWAPVWLLQVHL